MNLTNYDESFVPTADDLTLADQWIVQNTMKLYKV